MSRVIIGPEREPPPLPPLYNTVGGPRPMPPQGRPRVEVVEPLHDPTWSSPGTFGRRIQLFQLPGAGELVYPETPDVATGVFQNRKFPGPPRPVGVQFFRVPNREGVGNNNSDFRARLTYGCSGIVNVLDLDWLQGAQFPLVCDTLEISAVTYAPDGTNAYSRIASGSVQLGAVVGASGLAVSRLPTYTTEIREVVAGTAEAFRIPDLARVVWPMIFIPSASTATMADLRIDMLLNAAQLFERVTLTDQLNQQGFVIPGGTTRVRIANTDATDPVRAALVFGIGL